MKKFAFSFVMVFLLIGLVFCFPHIKTNQERIDTARNIVIPLSGKGVEQMSVAQRLKDFNSPNEGQAIFLITKPDDFAVSSTACSLYGETTTVEVKLSGSDQTEQNTAPLFLLQAFEKSKTERDTKILINGKKVSPQSLNDYIIWQTDSYVIYDMLELTYGESYESYISAYIQANGLQNKISSDELLSLRNRVKQTCFDE